MEISICRSSDGVPDSTEETFRRDLRVEVTVRSRDTHTHGEMTRYHSPDRIRAILAKAATDIAFELRQVSNEERVRADLATRQFQPNGPPSSTQCGPRGNR